MASFAQKVKRFADNAKKKVDQDVRAIEIALFASVIKATPVDTGRARGNWQTTTGQPASGVLDRDDPSGGQAVSDVVSKVGGAGNRTFLTNNLPYATTLEYGGYPDPVQRGTYVKGTRKNPGHYEKRSEGGYSKQAPAGMVRINMARIDQIIKDAVE